MIVDSSEDVKVFPKSPFFASIISEIYTEPLSNSANILDLLNTQSNECEVRDLISTAYKNISDKNSIRKISSIKFLTQFMVHLYAEYEAIFDKILECSMDFDSRVRSVTIEALASIYSSCQVQLPDISTMFDKMLNDPIDDVRMISLRLLVAHSNYHESHSRQTFDKISEMIRDSTLTVRVEAMKNISLLEGVSEHVLLTTFDRQVISDLKKVVGFSEKQKNLYRSGLWSAGQKWTTGSSVFGLEDIDPDEIRLTGLGGMGVFLEALEDEFSAVRIACVRSIGKFAEKYSRFRDISMGYIIDLLSDDICEVRMATIECLRSSIASYLLRVDQVEIMFDILHDMEEQIRNSFHDIIPLFSFESSEAFQKALNYIIYNLELYPEDYMSIWRIMTQLGSLNANFVNVIIYDLLNMDPDLDPVEPHINDKAYIANLLLMINAAKQNSLIFNVFPPYMKSHYFYLCSLVPHFTPHISQFHVDDPILDVKSFNSLKSPIDYVRDIFTASVNLIRSTDWKKSIQNSEIDHYIENLKLAADRNEKFKPYMKFSAIFVEIEVLIRRFIWTFCPSFPIRNSIKFQQRKFQLEKINALVFDLIYKFVNFAENPDTFCCLMRTRLWIINLVHFCQTEQDLAVGDSKFEPILAELRAICDSNDSAFLTELSGIIMNSTPDLIINRCISALRDDPFLPFLPFVDTDQVTLEISPTVERLESNPHVFPALFSSKVMLNLEMRNIKMDKYYVVVQIRYPEQSIGYHLIGVDFLACKNKFERCGGKGDVRDGGYISSCEKHAVMISHEYWNGPSYVEFRIGFYLGETAFFPKFLQFDGPVKYFVSPKKGRS